MYYVTFSCSWLRQQFQRSTPSMFLAAIQYIGEILTFVIFVYYSQSTPIWIYIFVELYKRYSWEQSVVGPFVVMYDGTSPRNYCLKWTLVISIVLDIDWLNCEGVKNRREKTILYEISPGKWVYFKNYFVNCIHNMISLLICLNETPNFIHYFPELIGYFSFSSDWQLRYSFKVHNCYGTIH